MVQLAPKWPLSPWGLHGGQPSPLSAVPWKPRCRAPPLQWMSVCLSRHCLSQCFFISWKKSCSRAWNGPASPASHMTVHRGGLSVSVLPVVRLYVHLVSEQQIEGLVSPPQTSLSVSHVPLREGASADLSLQFCFFPWVDQLQSNCRKCFSKIRYFYCRSTV